MSEANFDFHKVDEEEDKLDYGRLTHCPHCQKPIAHNATICYFCGRDIDALPRSAWVIWVVVGLVIMFLALILLGR